MVSHPEVIIGAPDDDFPGTGRSAIQGARKAAHARVASSSAAEVSRGITATVYWATLFVLVVHLGFAFYEFDNLDDMVNVGLGR